jgi:hypothetical protein
MGRREKEHDRNRISTLFRSHLVEARGNGRGYY